MMFRKKPIIFVLILVSMISFPSFIHSNVNNFSPYQISIPPSDAYADEIVEGVSYIYLFGENALGAPDGEYAQLLLEYTNGILTLDMGRYEKILNGTGDDFTVHCLSGGYIVKAGNDVKQPLTTLGEGENTTSFDLADGGLVEARYVQVQYLNGTVVYLDAIEALNGEIPLPEAMIPDITPVDDFWVWENSSKVEFTWEISEYHPWNYTIIVNDIIYEQGEWLETNIDFSYDIDGPEVLQIMLEANDYYGYSAGDTVTVEIREIDKASSLSVILSLLSLFGVVYILKKNK